MRYLTQEHWVKFYADGKLFEELIGELLKSEFGVYKFIHLGGPHDGSRDFEAIIPLMMNSNEKIWVECKYHKKNPLPIHDVSMTLLMAYIKHTNKILFFSYSLVNRNFMKHIADYKARSGKNVQVFDDEELEEMIFRNKSKIQFTKYFPAFNNKIDTQYFHSQQQLYCMYNISNSGNHDHKETFYLNKTISLELTIINKMNENFKAEINLETDDNNIYEILDFDFHKSRKKVIEISACSSELVNIRIRIKYYKPKISLPRVRVNFSNGCESINIIKKKLYCVWLAETDIVGQQNKEFLLTANKMLAETKCFGTILLEGKGGVGKSRLLKEIEFSSMACGKRVFCIDTDKICFSAEIFLRRLVAALVELPLFSEKDTERFYSIKALKHKNDDHNQYAMRILYDSDFKIDENKYHIARYLNNLLYNKPCLILVDNVQFVDSLSLEILQLLYDHLDDKFCQSAVVLCFNSDYLYEDTDAHILYKRIKLRCVKDKASCLYFCAQEFSREEAEEYLRLCLSMEKSLYSKDIEYEAAIQKMIDNSVTTPLYLQHLLLYLEQKKVIDQINNHFYISNVLLFLEELQTLPPDIQTLIEKRTENFFLNNVTGVFETDYFSFVRMLAFLKNMPWQIYTKLFNASKILNKMLANGLTKAEDGYITFYHQYIERYYQAAFPAEDLDCDILKRYINIAENSYYRNELFVSLFLAKFSTSSLLSEDLNKAVKIICAYNVDTHFYQRLFSTIDTIIKSNTFAIETKEFLSLYNAMALCIVRIGGINKAQIYRKSLSEAFHKDPIRFESLLKPLFSSLQEYLSSMMNIYQTKNALTENQRLVKKLQSHFGNNQETNSILVKLMNYQALSFNQLREMPKALDASNNAMQLAKQSKVTETIITAWQTRGDVYYAQSNCVDYIAQISECWNNSYSLYTEKYGNYIDCKINDGDDENIYHKRSLLLNTYMRAAVAYFIIENISDANSIMDYLTGYLDHTGMMFFEVKLRMLITAKHLLQDHLDKEKFDYCMKLLRQALDICAVYGNLKMSVDCFHLMAQVQLKHGHNTQALENYSKAFFSLAVKGQYDEAFLEREHLLLDMALCFRRLSKQMPDAILNMIKPEQIRNNMEKILNITDSEFDNFLKNKSRFTVLYDKYHYLNLPKL